MMGKEDKLSTDLPPEQINDSSLIVADITRYLLSLARIHADETTGNAKLSNGLRSVVAALRRFRAYPVADLEAMLGKPIRVARNGSSHSSDAPSLPSDLASATYNEVERILENPLFTKQQLAELGFQRFGISRPHIIKLRKKDALFTIGRSLANEKTLDMIERRAREAGDARAGYRHTDKLDYKP